MEFIFEIRYTFVRIILMKRQIFIMKMIYLRWTFNRDKDIISDSIIPIDKMKAPILILSSKHDSVWPSYESSIYIEDRLTEIDFPYEHKHVAYENMSHALLTNLPIIYKMAFKSERENEKPVLLIEII